MFLTWIFSDSPQNTLSDAAKFIRGLRCTENRCTTYSGTFPPPFPGRLAHNQISW